MKYESHTNDHFDHHHDLPHELHHDHNHDEFEEEIVGCGHHHHHHHEHHDIFPPNYHLITSEHELKHILTELFIRFDGKSGNYLTDDDFRLLTKLLAQSLIYLYKRDKHVATVIQVDKLPPFHHAEIGAIYMVPKVPREEGENEFVEYIFVGDHYELVGGEGSSADITIIGKSPVVVTEKDNTWTIGIDQALLDKISDHEERIQSLEERVQILEEEQWIPINLSPKQ